MDPSSSLHPNFSCTLAPSNPSLHTQSSSSSSSSSSFSSPPPASHSGLAHQLARRDEFLDLEELRFLSVQGIDTQGRKILRIVGRFFPAPVVDSTRLKDYVVQKVLREIAKEQFCIVYFHTRVKRNENCPGVITLRWIYETLPQEYRQGLQVVYFVHPGLLSRTILGTVGRFCLSEGFYWKLKYINRIEFLSDYVKIGQIEIPDFVQEHDAELEHRPLMDYGLETDPLHMYGMPDVNPAFHRAPVR